MGYGDEANLALRRDAMHKAQLDIRFNSDVNNNLLIFSRRLLFENKVSIVLPENYKEMSHEQAKFKYPSEFRPQLILTDDSSTVNFTFSYLEQETVSNEDIIGKQESLRMASKRMRPADVFESVKTIKTEFLTIPWYVSRATAFDADLFVVQFLATIDSKLLMGGFSCVYGYHDDWLLQLPQCLATIKDETHNANEEG